MILLMFLAVTVAVILLLIRWRRSNLVFALALGLWLGLPFYNQWIFSRCSGDCSIRVDLLLVGPLILLASGFAVFEAFRRWRGGAK